MLTSLEFKAPKQFNIINYLFKVRGATVEQIVMAVWEIPINAPSFVSSRESVYQILRKLIAKKLVERANRGPNEGGVYYLTQTGYEGMIAYHDIQPLYVGKGFNQDFGYFNYSLTTPTLSNIEHFLKQVDVFNTYETCEHTYPGVFDYRDNRYAATIFNLPSGQKSRFRPDGEMKIMDDVFEIEVDRANERGEALVNKFKGYNRYFEWLVKEGGSLPKGIIVVIPDRSKRFQNQLVNANEQVRFQSFYQAFVETCKKYVEKVELHLTELRHFEARLTLMIPEQLIEFERKALSYIKSLSNNERTIAIGEMGEYKIAVVTQGNVKHYYFILNGEGYKSEPWSKFYKVFRQFQRENKNIYLILYFSRFFPVPPLKGADLQQVKDIESRNFYERTYYLDLGASVPIWYNSERAILNHEPFSISN